MTTRSVYVQGLAWSTTNEGLAAYFSTAGNIVNANVLYRTRGGKIKMRYVCVVNIVFVIIQQAHYNRLSSSRRPT